MIRIAVVDDDEKLCFRMEEIFLAYKEVTPVELSVDVFFSGESFCKYITNDKSNYDLIFLDIQMQVMDGVKVGKYIRETLEDNITQIIYITSLEGRDRELFDIRPMGFIAKPISDYKIYKYLEKYIQLYMKNKTTFDITSDRKHLKIPYEKILYLKSDDKKVIIQTQSEIYSYYGKLVDSIPDLPYQFLVVHKSYVINKFYIDNYKYDRILMANGTVISISKSNRKSVRKLLMQSSTQVGEEFFH